MKLEDAKIGTRVITKNGNIATIIGFWGDHHWARLRLASGGISAGNIYRLRPAPNPEEIVEHTLEAFARSTVKRVTS